MLLVSVEVAADEACASSAGCTDAVTLEDPFGAPKSLVDVEAVDGSASPSSPSSYSCSYLPKRVTSINVGNANTHV